MDPMRLHDRSVLNELIVPFWIGVAAFLTMLVGNTLFQVLEQMVRDRWPVAMVGRILLFNIPVALQMALPVACALAPGLAWGRLVRDAEITAMRAAGISLRRLAAPALALGLAAAVGSGLLATRTIPWAWKQQNNIEGWLANLPVTSLDTSLTFTSDQTTVTWWSMRRTGPREFAMDDVTVFDRGGRPAGRLRVVQAEQGRYRAGMWTLSDVVVHEFAPDGTAVWDAQAKTMEMPLAADFGRGFLGMAGEQLQNLSLEELSVLEAASSDPARKRECATARWFKWALPSLCLPMALLAIPIAHRFGRSGGFAAVLAALVMALLGQVAMVALQSLSISGALAPQAASFLPAFVFTATGLLWLRRCE